jgi:hypothetical protein
MSLCTGDRTEGLDHMADPDRDFCAMMKAGTDQKATLNMGSLQSGSRPIPRTGNRSLVICGIAPKLLSKPTRERRRWNGVMC